MGERMHSGEADLSHSCTRPDEQLGQLYELMQAIQKEGREPEGESQ